MRGISWLAEDLLATQEGLYFIVSQLVSKLENKGFSKKPQTNTVNKRKGLWCMRLVATHHFKTDVYKKASLTDCTWVLRKGYQPAHTQSLCKVVCYLPGSLHNNIQEETRRREIPGDLDRLTFFCIETTPYYYLLPRALYCETHDSL